MLPSSSSNKEGQGTEEKMEGEEEGNEETSKTVRRFACPNEAKSALIVPDSVGSIISELSRDH